MKTRDLRIGDSYLVVSPYCGPQGKATVIMTGAPPPEHRPSYNVLVEWAPGIHIYTSDRRTLVRPTDVIRPWDQDD